MAAIAVPRLTATREDAEVVLAKQNLDQFIKDITNMMTSQGNWPPTWEDVTNAVIVQTNGKTAKSLATGTTILYLKQGDERCIAVNLVAASAGFGPKDMKLGKHIFAKSGECDAIYEYALKMRYIDTSTSKRYKFESTGINP